MALWTKRKKKIIIKAYVVLDIVSIEIVIEVSNLQSQYTVYVIPEELWTISSSRGNYQVGLDKTINLSIKNCLLYSLGSPLSKIKICLMI